MKVPYGVRNVTDGVTKMSGRPRSVPRVVKKCQKDEIQSLDDGKKMSGRCQMVAGRCWEGFKFGQEGGLWCQKDFQKMSDGVKKVSSDVKKMQLSVQKVLRCQMVSGKSQEGFSWHTKVVRWCMCMCM